MRIKKMKEKKKTPITNIHENFWSRSHTIKQPHHYPSKLVLIKLKESYLSIRKLTPRNTTKHTFTNKIFTRKVICILLRQHYSESFCRTCIQTLNRMSICSYFERYHQFHRDLERKNWRWWWQEVHIHDAHVWIMILLGQLNCKCVFHIFILFILKLWKYTCSSIVFNISLGFATLPLGTANNIQKGNLQLEQNVRGKDILTSLKNRNGQ